jgi:hypothetical protein
MTMHFVPEGVTRERMEEALLIPADDLPSAVIGHDVSAQDTVPFCLRRGHRGLVLATNVRRGVNHPYWC